MINAAELETMRSTTEATMPDTATIRRVTLAADTYGGRTETWTTVATVAVRVSPSGQARGNQGNVGAAVAAVADWTITLPADTDVTTKDRIVVGSRTFEVKEVVARSWEITRRVYCSEVIS